MKKMNRVLLEHNANVIEKRYDQLTANVYTHAITNDGLYFVDDESVEDIFGASKFDVMGAAGDLTIDGILLLKNHGYGRGCTIEVDKKWHDEGIETLEAILQANGMEV